LRVYGVAPDLLTLCSFGYPLPKKLIIFGERKDLIFLFQNSIELSLSYLVGD